MKIFNIVNMIIIRICIMNMINNSIKNNINIFLYNGKID